MELVWGPIEDRENPGLHVQAFYLTESHEFRVEASYKDKGNFKIVPASWTPAFGVDAEDMQLIFRAAAELADDLATGEP